ncbi:undecaprenyl/decaprenyl-phosphate alpha-N-acetylglucosaminyl 1-phosphate transferase [bacterium]|nr:undecaprenyl/decaprenyl-phosphate alpha-N-acetylglucosaminyl 1-phosphate transferase [bacterium]
MWTKIYILVFFTSGILSLIFTKLAGVVAKKTGIIDMPSSRKVHKQPIPLLGGLGIYFSFALTILIGLFLAKLQLMPGYLLVHSPGISHTSKKLAVILTGGFLVVAFGLIDDIKGVKPFQKLILQTIVAIIVFMEGMRISLFLPTLFHSFVLTIGWFVLIMNSFNLMDNMDGLSTGVAFITGSILFIFALQMNQLFIATILAAFLGSIVGFLKYNLPPAKIFMGECGSSFIGFFLATISILMTFYRYEKHQTFLPFFAPLIIFSILFFDTTSVIWIRTKRKLPIFKADKNHFSHRLVNIGMSQKQAVLFIYLLTICTGIGSLLLSNLNTFGGILVIIQVFIIISLTGILEFVGKKKEERIKNS